MWRSSSIRYNSVLFCLRFASNSCLQLARVLLSFNLMAYDYLAQRLYGSQPSPPLNQWGGGGGGGGEGERDPEDLKDLIYRLAVRSYKECLEPTANYVRMV